MIAVPAVEGWRDIYGPVYGSRVEGDRERKKAKRNIAKCKSQSEGIKGAGRQPGENQRRNQQTVIVDERQESAGRGE